MNLLAEAMKQGILGDMVKGVVPYSVRSFSELHDYVDANCYGGLCDATVIEDLIAWFGSWDDKGGMTGGALAYVNDAQNEVNRWLKSGRVK